MFPSTGRRVREGGSARRSAGSSCAGSRNPKHPRRLKPDHVESTPMSRHRFCMTSDRDGFIEELAVELWEERQGGIDAGAWADADPQVQQDYIRLAADTLRFLEHGHG